MSDLIDAFLEDRQVVLKPEREKARRAIPAPRGLSRNLALRSLAKQEEREDTAMENELRAFAEDHTEEELIERLRALWPGLETWRPWL